MATMPYAFANIPINAKFKYQGSIYYRTIRQNGTNAVQIDRFGTEIITVSFAPMDSVYRIK